MECGLGFWIFISYSFRIFDLEQPSEPIIKLEGHTGGIKQVMYSPDNKQLLSCSDDKTVRVWDTANGAEIRSYTTADPIGGLELSREGDIITLAAGNKVIFLDAHRLVNTALIALWWSLAMEHLIPSGLRS